MLDAFCGEGGAAEGYRRAGFEIVGIDLNDDHADRLQRPRPRPLKRYPFPCVQGDALAILRELREGGAIVASDGRSYRLGDFAAAHASPPCQAFSSITRINRAGSSHPDLIAPTRAALDDLGLPYVIENVERAPLLNAVLLCGSMFDPPLDVQRHRLFEANWTLLPPPWPCRHKLWAPRYRSADYHGRKSVRLMKVVPVYGGTRFVGDHALRRKAMEIDWMTSYGLKESIPPRYTEFIGAQLLAAAHLGGAMRSSSVARR